MEYVRAKHGRRRAHIRHPGVGIVDMNDISACGYCENFERTEDGTPVLLSEKDFLENSCGLCLRLHAYLLHRERVDGKSISG